MNKEFVTLKLEDIIPYPNNPRHNDEAVKYVVQSIKDTENLDPIEVDENNVILSGHTRLKALQELGYKETECIRYHGLTEEKKKIYRLLANKVGEKATWDFDALETELEDLPDFDAEFYDFGYEFNESEELEVEDIKGEVPFTEFIDEESNYIVLKFNSHVDWLQAQSLFELKEVKAYSTRKDGKITEKMERKGTGRVIDGVDFINKLIGGSE